MPLEEPENVLSYRFESSHVIQVKKTFIVVANRRVRLGKYWLSTFDDVILNAECLRVGKTFCRC